MEENKTKKVVKKVKSKMKESNLEKKTLHKCDCGHFHETMEMETITLKIRKGKDCSMEQTIAALFPNTNAVKENASVAATPEANKVATVVTPTGTITVQTAPRLGEAPVTRPKNDLDDPAATTIKTLTPEEKAKFLKESAIPAEFLRRVNPLIRPGIGIPNYDPQSESKGAKEIRVV